MPFPGKIPVTIPVGNAAVPADLPDLSEILPGLPVIPADKACESIPEDAHDHIDDHVDFFDCL